MRASGILLHITSLPSPYGIGDLGPQAYAMADFLALAGQKYWQVLPVNPTDGINGHSPYSCFSAFAGNPLLISPAQLVKDGFLKQSEVPSGSFDKNSVDYGHVIAYKEKLFDKAFANWMRHKDKGDYEAFCERQKNWLVDFALFQTAKDAFKGKSWNEWPMPLRRRQPKALEQFGHEHERQVQRIIFIQYLFDRQWHAFKSYVHKKGIRIIGDIPIYVNYDSAEVWCYPQFFKLTEKKELKFVSGCPPDYFSKTGQRWGNPVYDWAVLKKDRYSWWQRRIMHNLEFFDCLRIDHFRGFVSFWQIPAHEKFAVFGRWVKGPGHDFFKTMNRQFDHLPLIAEDLGEITDDVIKVMHDFRFPGMRVLLFGFGGNLKTNPHVPANYPANCVAYTGTHDNNTVQGWLQQEAKPHELSNIPKVLGRPFRPKDLHWTMIGVLMNSKANVVIIPLSDVLGLNAQARMNTPATKANNWKWRVNPKLLTPAVARHLLNVTKENKRVSP